MRHAWLLVPLMLAPPAFAAERDAGGIFCYDQSELDSWRNGMSPIVRDLMPSGRGAK